jgi:hypothetical protein
LLLGAEEGYWVGFPELDALSGEVERGQPKSQKKYRDRDYFGFGRLTEKGEKYFQGPPSCGSEAGHPDRYGDRWAIQIRIPHGHITNITGITGDDRNKKVELEWVPDMNELPGDLRQLFPVQEQPLHEGKINLTLYDDGWRVVSGTILGDYY